jgi:hypothetical protein
LRIFTVHKNVRHFLEQNANDDDDDDDVEDGPDSFDSFKIVKRKGKKHFCKCKRGPMGHPGVNVIRSSFLSSKTKRGNKLACWSFAVLSLLV